MNNPDRRPAEVRAQAKLHAKRARVTMDERRSQQDGGICGWVAERAGKWDLSGQDEDTLQRQKFIWNALIDYWFRMEIDGWEHVPGPPALLVGIQSGAPFVWDAWTVGLQWWRCFGQDRPLHGTAHDALMAIPIFGHYFRSMGVLPAPPDAIATALAEGRDMALWPGGEVDSMRPWAERDRANRAGRKGFVKMAIRAGVPIVPIATVGGADAMPVLIRGNRLSRVLKLDRLLRLKVFPLTTSGSAKSGASVPNSSIIVDSVSAMFYPPERTGSSFRIYSHALRGCFGVIPNYLLLDSANENFVQEPGFQRM